MKAVSWNVNGLRACVGKGFTEYVEQNPADFICLQETKLQAGQLEILLPPGPEGRAYRGFWSYALRKGYSGTAIFTPHEPLSVQYGLGIPAFDAEGRAITLEYADFYLVNVYSPNAQQELARIDFRLEWERALRAHLCALDRKKPVVLCGDLNVAHEEIDLKNPKTNRGNAGFSDEERGAFLELLAAGFTDSFRQLHPDATGAYSWWSYRYHARQNNAGWRIDYFVVSNRLAEQLTGAGIQSEVMGSDHCPVWVSWESRI